MSPIAETTVNCGRFRDGAYGCVDEVAVAAPPEAIYRLLRDFNRRHEWWPGLSAEIRTGEPLAVVGSHIVMGTGVGPIRLRIGLKITEVEENRRLAYEYVEGAVRGWAEWRIDPLPDGRQRVRLVLIKVWPVGLAAGAVFLLSGTRLHSRQTARGLLALKRRLES